MQLPAMVAAGDGAGNGQERKGGATNRCRRKAGAG